MDAIMQQNITNQEELQKVNNMTAELKTKIEQSKKNREKEKRRELIKKKKLYQKLGAKQWKKITFLVEKIKYRMLKKLWPNFIEFYDKRCDSRKEKLIKKATSPEEIQEIIKGTKYSKMAIRKEINQERNCNYHLDNNNPTEACYYSKLNKQIHEDEIKKNLAVLPLGITTLSLGFPAIGVAILLGDLLSFIINLECINLQNYNITRFKISEEKLQKKYNQRLKENIENCGEVNEVIHNWVKSEEKIPVIEDKVAELSLEQKKQLLELLDRQINDVETYENYKIEENYSRGRK